MNLEEPSYSCSGYSRCNLIFDSLAFLRNSDQANTLQPCQDLMLNCILDLHAPSRYGPANYYLIYQILALYYSPSHYMLLLHPRVTVYWSVFQTAISISYNQLLVRPPWFPLVNRRPNSVQVSPNDSLATPPEPVANALSTLLLPFHVKFAQKTIVQNIL